MADSVISWWATIQSHYAGDLENFGDATSVRIMLYNAKEWIRADNEQVAALKEYPETQKNWIEGSAGFRAEYQPIIAACEAWLDKRGLPHD